jgi:predicted RNA-binding Zn ribbon-like protein
MSPLPSSEPADRPPAPEPIRIVQLFVNTVDFEDADGEGLPDAAALGDWLVASGLLEAGTAVTAGDHARALELREALRALALANGGHDADEGAVAVVNEAARRAGLHPILTGPAEARLEPTADGVDAALGRIVAAVHAGVADGTWRRLKACERITCRWAYYDQSRNRSGHWCSMAVCGSREKNRRAYRRRTRGADTARDAARDR